MDPIDIKAERRLWEGRQAGRALHATQGDVRAAAPLLGLSERGLWALLRRCDVRPDAYRGVQKGADASTDTAPATT